MDPRSRGTNDLIRQGATLVEEVDDVLRVLDSQTGFRAPQTYGWDGAGEAQAVRSAIAKSLIEFSGSESLKKDYMHYDRFMVVDDSRRVEPKKFKGPKARARFQKSYR